MFGKKKKLHKMRYHNKKDLYNEMIHLNIKSDQKMQN